LLRTWLTVQPAPTAAAAAPPTTTTTTASSDGKNNDNEKDKEKDGSEEDKKDDDASTSGGGGAEEQVSAAASEILSRITEDSIFDMLKLRKKFPTKYDDSMNSVLCQELDRFNGLLQIIRTSLYSVQRAAAGVEVMSDELELVFQAIFNGQVPNMWKSKSYPTLKSLTDYIHNLTLRKLRNLILFFFCLFSIFVFIVATKSYTFGRSFDHLANHCNAKNSTTLFVLLFISLSVSFSKFIHFSSFFLLFFFVVVGLDFFNKWIERGDAPTSLWLPGFFFTHAVMTGSLQNFCRKHHHAIDHVEFEYEPFSSTQEDVAFEQKPETGIYVYGFFVEGAKWSDIQMGFEESQPRTLYTRLPVLWMKPKLKGHSNGNEGDDDNDMQMEEEQNLYNCPLYNTSERRGQLSTTGHSTNFIMYLKIGSGEQTPDHWCKRGTACLMQLD